MWTLLYCCRALYLLSYDSTNLHSNGLQYLGTSYLLHPCNTSEKSSSSSVDSTNVKPPEICLVYLHCSPCITLNSSSLSIYHITTRLIIGLTPVGLSFPIHICISSFLIPIALLVSRSILLVSLSIFRKHTKCIQDVLISVAEVKVQVSELRNGMRSAPMFQDSHGRSVAVTAIVAFDITVEFEVAEAKTEIANSLWKMK